ncbi:hypothetical protein Syun_024793 [Stephania yunnanensis]|uniref:7-dehydrocholesterol reductase n=1 Tax=Stephania yunnanensis TaxID=152371 RepID=A0AAP0EXJ0_9MAGN
MAESKMVHPPLVTYASMLSSSHSVRPSSFSCKSTTLAFTFAFSRSVYCLLLLMSRNLRRQAPIGCLIGMLIADDLCVFAWYTMVHADGSVYQTWEFLKQNGLQGLKEIWPRPTVIAWEIIACFAAFEAALQLWLPGKKVMGPISLTGNQPVYKSNGLAAYAVTLGHLAPSSTDSGSSGNVIIDFYWLDFMLLGESVLLKESSLCDYDFAGFELNFTKLMSSCSSCAMKYLLTVGMELYPRIGKNFDIKVFTNCRFGMMSWAVLAVTYCIKQYEENGHVADSMLVNTILMLAYITKFFLWEAGYWNTMDIAHDRVWVPSIYTSPGMYLVNHPVHLGTQLALSILVAGILCIFINYDCDRQRQEFRRTNGKCIVWGKAPSKIVASYQTSTGETKTSLLLTSGWWGLARHFHYVPEILSAFFWTVPALFNHCFPYFYVVFVTILLMDRAKRDDDRCRTK